MDLTKHNHFALGLKQNYFFFFCLPRATVCKFVPNYDISFRFCWFFKPQSRHHMMGTKCHDEQSGSISLSQSSKYFSLKSSQPNFSLFPDLSEIKDLSIKPIYEVMCESVAQGFPNNGVCAPGGTQEILCHGRFHVHYNNNWCVRG